MEYFDPRGGTNRYKINTDFFKKWSNEMAYVLGFLYADGTIIDSANSSRTRYIKFTSKDRDILLSIKNVLQSEHPICYRSPRETIGRNGKIYKSSGLFYLRIGSRRMFMDLKKLGLIPNKSKIIEFSTTIPNKYLSHFVRGYFDGDGCVYFQVIRGKKKKFIVKHFSIIFTSGSKKFLEELSTNLNKVIGVTKKRIYDSTRAYQLHYSVFDSIQLFKFLYKDVSQETYLKRKFDIFLKYFQLRPIRIDRNIKVILKNLKRWPGTQEDRERSAKPFYASANLAQASR